MILLTDLYQLTMSAAYFESGQLDRRGVFHFFFRKHPFKGGFAICAGLENLLEFVENAKFEQSDLEYLQSLKNPEGGRLFKQEFLDYLADFKFDLNIHAMPEGTVCFAMEPLVSVEGPLLHCQLLETALSNFINFQTLIATKAARMFIAAKGLPIFEFGLRRAQGVDGGVSASRAAYIGGCEATSNVLAGKNFDIPVVGTHSHSWVLSQKSEEDAFSVYSDVYPENCVFLIDTYSTFHGLQRAIDVAKRKNLKLLAVRLDSGDLAYLSANCREILDNNGLEDTKIIASGDLDEFIIESLIDQDSKIDIWAVGTNLVTAQDQPSLGGVYKLAALEENKRWIPKIKISEDVVKMNIPCHQQVLRYFNSENTAIGDKIIEVGNESSDTNLIFSPSEPFIFKKIPPGIKGKELLVPVIKQGKRVYPKKNLSKIRAETIRQLKSLDKSIKRFINPHSYPAGMDENLHDLRNTLIRKHKEQ